MKKSVDVLGLPVVSISEGKELGSVKSLVINHTVGSVAGLIVDDGKWYLGAKVLPFGDIAGMGEYAVTVENSTKLLSVITAPEYENFLAADVQIIGAKVLTKGGRIQGKVTEIIFDGTGKIASCEIQEAEGEINHIPAQRIITFGKEILFITDVEEPVTNAAPALKPQIAAVPVAQTSIAVPDSAAPAQDDDSARKFEEKHRKYLLGKKASRRIETDNGVVIVEQGGEITEEVIQKAKLAGKFVELSMNIQ